jgi:RimJ/RimL family protein N-acetyltransferase
VIELGPTLTTARLVLRPPVQADFEAWAACMADEEAARFIGGVQPASIAWRGMAAMVGSWALQGFGMFSVLERETGRWIGRVGPHHPHGWPGDEVGWGLARDAWGRGYAREAATASLDWAFDVLGWREVVHCIDPRNVLSIRLAERLGSRCIGPGKMPAPYEDTRIDLYGQTAQAWRAHRAAL